MWPPIVGTRKGLHTSVCIRSPIVGTRKGLHTSVCIRSHRVNIQESFLLKGEIVLLQNWYDIQSKEINDTGPNRHLDTKYLSCIKCI